MRSCTHTNDVRHPKIVSTYQLHIMVYFTCYLRFSCGRTCATQIKEGKGLTHSVWFMMNIFLQF